MLIHIMANNTKMEPWIKRFTVSDEFQQILKATGQLRDEIKEFRQQYQYMDYICPSSNLTRITTMTTMAPPTMDIRSYLF